MWKENMPKLDFIVRETSPFFSEEEKNLDIFFGILHIDLIVSYTI